MNFRCCKERLFYEIEKILVIPFDEKFINFQNL